MRGRKSSGELSCNCARGRGNQRTNWNYINRPWEPSRPGQIRSPLELITLRRRA